MSHLLYWPSITYFYPVGNTSAVYLTENLSPECKADVLLLACGDPRHILYTIYVEETNPLTRSRPFDVTCCDVDVAILARNALLLTLLADDGAIDRLDELWNLFYHMFIDQTTLSILFEQCRKLVPLAENLDTWRTGPYGHFLTTCDAATLAGLRRMWSAYLDTASFSEGQASQFERSLISGMSDMAQKGKASAARSAGPLASHAHEAVSSQFRTYWSSGTTDRGPGRQPRLTVNPTFAYSLDGDEFAVHYMSDPLCGFHLAEAFAAGDVARDLARVAKDQFSRWCTSASRRLKDVNPSSSTFVVRMFAGDVLRFCQALKYCRAMRTPVTPYAVAAWRLSTIALDDRDYGENATSPAPLSFDVIDTSNILDHVGLVNLLVVTAPLLRETPSATLYTEALLRKGDDTSQVDLEHLCGNLPTMALLLGIIPSTHMSQFTTRSNVYTTLTTEGGCPYHERLAWKAVGSGGPKAEPGANDDPTPPPHRLSFQPEHLAKFLFHVYLQMFSDEDTDSRFQQPPFLSFAGFMQNLKHSGILHYTRRSFALLVHLAKTRIQTDWQRTMALFEKLVMSDTRLQMGQHAYQELCCHLHLLGVYTPPWMTAPTVQRLRVEYEGPATPTTKGMFHDWPQTRLPQVVTLALVVPRDVLTRLEPAFKQVGTPMMQCDLHDGTRVNRFAVTSATFGSLRVSGSGARRTAVVVADADCDAGGGMLPPWRTEAPMIMTVEVPSGSVMDFGRNPEAAVGVSLRATPGVASRLMDQLGPELMVYQTKLRDAERVFVLAQAPVMSTSVGPSNAGPVEVMVGHWQENVISKQAGGDPDAPQNAGTHVQVQMNELASAVQSFTIRIDVTNTEAQAVLANKKIVPTVNSSSGSTRSLDACVKIEKHTFSIRFPLPVDTTRAKLRVARKSSYVEVVAPLAPPDGRPERDITNRFAPLSSNPSYDGIPMLGSIHHLNLDRCPTFKLPKDQFKSSWFDAHLHLMFSEREEERALLKELELSELVGSATKPEPDTFLNVKQTLRVLLRSAADATRESETPGKVFVLCDASRRGIPYLYIAVARMCLDVGSHTVVADAFVALGTPAVRAALETTPRDTGLGARWPGPGNLDDDAVQRLTTDADETAAWFHLLPYLIERCRTWPHKTNCPYRTAQQQGEEKTRRRRSSLCMCGLGVGTKALPKAFERIAPYLTRAAFSPLMSVPYLEEMDEPATEGDPFMNERTFPWEDDVFRTPLNDWMAPDVDDAEPPGMELGCRVCGKEGGRACSGCKRARYCSRACQRADWKSHKKYCH